MPAHPTLRPNGGRAAPLRKDVMLENAIAPTPILAQDPVHGRPRCIEFAAWHLLCLIEAAKDYAYRRKRPQKGGIHYDKGEENTRQVTHRPCRPRRLHRPGGIG